MTGKLLQVIGLSTVLGMFTAIVAGTILLHDRVRIVVQDGAAGERPDQAALLLDDLQQLRAELEEQRQAISQGLSQLAEASERNAARRQTELQGSLGTLAELRAQLRDLAQQNAQLADRIARLAAAGSVRAAEPAVSTPEPAAAANPAELPAAAAPGTPTVEAPAAGPPAAAPGQNFLSFHLPDRRFR
ncbi:MAG TPA: hypothetical protein VK348_13855, partial [Planctomycetota bacterium]|nr:hypothetical protein [Planctomycetota bacterium]